MKKLRAYIKQYEIIMQERQKVTIKEGPLHAKTFGLFVVLAGVAYLIGLLFGLLQDLGYLISIGGIVVFFVFSVSRYLTEQEILSAQEKKYNIWTVVFMDSIFLILTLVSTLLTLLFTAYVQAATVVLTTVLVVLFVGSFSIYVMIRKHARKVILPSPLRVIINGVFIALLFYSLAMLFRIQIVALSFWITILSVYVFVELRVFVEKELVFHISRLAVIGIGPFLILLSFPFNQAFNVVSLNRGEFSLRMTYDKFTDPVHIFDSEIMGDIIALNGEIIIVGEDAIWFYDETDYTLNQSIPNNYDYVYEMNGRLLANQADTTNINYDTVLEWDGSSFVPLGNFFLDDITDKVYYNGDTYFTRFGYVYEKEAGSEDYTILPFDSNDDLTPIVEERDFIVFRRAYPYMATPTSFHEDFRGYNYEYMAYHNGNLAIVYSHIFIHQKPGFVAPEDKNKPIVYLVSTEDYFNDGVFVPPYYEVPDLYTIDKFYSIGERHYLVGHILYSTGNWNYTMLVIDEDGNMLNEVLLDNTNIDISEDHIIYEMDNRIQVFDTDSPTGLHYRIISGYGITFFVSALVAVFAIERIRLNPVVKE